MLKLYRIESAYHSALVYWYNKNLLVFGGLKREKTLKDKPTKSAKGYYCQECHGFFDMVWECMGCHKFKCPICLSTCDDIELLIKGVARLGIEMDSPVEMEKYNHRKATPAQRKQVEEGIFDE